MVYAVFMVLLGVAGVVFLAWPWIADKLDDLGWTRESHDVSTEPMEIWMDPVGDAKRFEIRIEGRDEVIKLWAQPRRGAEDVGRLSYDTQPFAITWTRVETGVGNRGTSTKTKTWPPASTEFPCTALARLLENKRPSFRSLGGDELELSASDSDATAVYNTSVYTHDEVRVIVSLDSMTGTYEHRAHCDLSD
jgi:hypothetical protein